MNAIERVKGHLVLHAEGVRLGLAVRLSDRFDFVASLLVMMGIELVPTLIVALLYGNGLSFPGWTMREAILVQGVFLMAKGVAYPLFGGMVWNTAEMIRSGTFELLMLLPRHPLQSCVVRAFDAEDLGKLVGGVGLVAWSLRGAPIPGLWTLVGFVLLFAMSLVLFLASAVTMASLLIVWVGNFRVYEIFETVASLGQFPPTMLPKRIRTLGVVGFPFAAFAVLPVSHLLGRSIPGVWAAAASTALALVAAIALWNLLLRRLTGAGG